MTLDKVKANLFINSAMKYLGDRYDMARRLEWGYSDCSSLIWKGLKDIGLLDESQTKRTVSTKYMRDGDPRFRRIDLKDAQRGDILWYQRPGTNDSNYFGHVAIILDDKQVLEAIKPRVAITSRNRIKYQRAYRIKALEAAPSKKPVQQSKKVIENVLIYIHNKLVPTRGYIINGTTFLEVNGSTIAVRKFFEGLKMKVEWKDGKVYIS